jgi:putative acetyltransferase
VKISIRSETPGDAGAIGDVTIAAFAEAEHAGHTEQFIVAALREAAALTISLVAEQDGCIVGHVAVSPVTISDGAENWYGLGPISVLPEFQGQGIGSQLMRHALAVLDEIGAAGCVLLGDPGYYNRFGFRVLDGLVYPGPPVEYFMALSLDGSTAQGEVSYHAAFDADG